MLYDVIRLPPPYLGDHVQLSNECLLVLYKVLDKLVVGEAHVPFSRQLLRHRLGPLLLAEHAQQYLGYRGS